VAWIQLLLPIAPNPGRRLSPERVRLLQAPARPHSDHVVRQKRCTSWGLIETGEPGSSQRARHGRTI